MNETSMTLWIYKRTNKYSLNIWNCNTEMSFLLFNEHLVFHKNWEQYNLYVKATLSNFPALRYVSDVDDYHKRFPTYHKILFLENPHFSKPRKQMEF